MEDNATKDSKIEGGWEKTKGKVKEVAGSVTGNPETKLEGREQQKMGEREMQRAELDKQDKKDLNRGA